MSENNRKGADLSEADLGEADLEYADLGYADLRGAYLGCGQPDDKCAGMSENERTGANLKETDLNGTILSGADLSYADLNGAEGWTAKQLEQAESLKGATMPNGQKYEDWLKDKEGQD